MMMMPSLPTAVVNTTTTQSNRQPSTGHRDSPPSSSASDHAHDDDFSTGSTLSVRSDASGVAAEHLSNTRIASSPGALGTTPVFQRKLHEAYHGQQQTTPPPPPSYFATPAVAQTPVKPHAAATSAAAARKRTAPKAPYRHDPYAPLPAAQPTSGRSTAVAAPVMHGISHQPLVGHCRYISWPEIAPLPTPGAEFHSSLPRLVIDQVKFELTAPQLRWLIHKLCGVVAVHVAALERGGFAAYFKTEADRARAQMLHRAILFDHHGAWAPSNAVESASVSRYMGSREFRQRGQRLPRELMTLLAKSAPSSSTTSTNSPLLPPY